MSISAFIFLLFVSSLTTHLQIINADIGNWCYLYFCNFFKIFFKNFVTHDFYPHPRQLVILFFDEDLENAKFTDDKHNFANDLPTHAETQIFPCQNIKFTC